jgi:hypothetical protein
MTINQTAAAGAIALNVPTLVAAAYLPAAPLAVMAVSLAALGGALGALVGWAVQPQADTAAMETWTEVEERLAA